MTRDFATRPVNDLYSTSLISQTWLLHPNGPAIPAEKDGISGNHKTIMRLILLLTAVMAACCTGALAANSQRAYSSLIEQVGIDQFLLVAPADITRASQRHASRCGSSAVKNTLTDKSLLNAMVTRLQWQHSSDEVQQLVSWYKSAAGRKTKQLEAQVIDEQIVAQHVPVAERLKDIKRIYHNTANGKLIPQVAVEIEYSGWLLSGCLEKAEASGDIKRVHKEMTRAHEIRQEAVELEALFEQYTLQSLSYLLTPLSNRELSQYADVTEHNANLYGALVNSLVGVIRAESKQNTVSSLP